MYKKYLWYKIGQAAPCTTPWTEGITISLGINAMKNKIIFQMQPNLKQVLSQCSARDIYK